MSEIIQTKRCSNCKQIKSATTKYFYLDKRSKNKFRSSCKQCQNRKSLQYYQIHKIERLKYDKQHYQIHKAKRQRSSKQYRQIHSVEIRQYRKQYRRTIWGYLKRIWHGMLYRCNNPKCQAFKWYGAQGIKVKFVSFDDFFYYVTKELKVDPRGLTIDRIDNNGHYERDNIRFISQLGNNRNKSHKYKIPFIAF